MPNPHCAYKNPTACRCAALVGLLLWHASSLSAEIIGRVVAQPTGLFVPADATSVPGGISVSITPLAGQSMPAAASLSHRVVIHNNRFAPVFMTVQRGDSLQFVSEDPVFHKLFSLSKVQPLALDLAKATVGAKELHSEQFQLTESGPWHVFCRIHSNMYFRVDVVDTPYYTTINSGAEFHFTGLTPGRWRVRVAAIGSEPLEFDADAITAPPPLEVVLPVHGGTGQSQSMTNTTPPASRIYPDD